MRSLRPFFPLPGQAGRAVALAAQRAESADGAEAGLHTIDETKVEITAPANFEALEARCDLLAKLERWDEALASIEQAPDQAPRSARLLVLRASIRRGQGELVAAVADLEAAPESCSRNTRQPSSISRACTRRLARSMRPGSCTRTRPALESDERELGIFAKRKAAIALARLDLEAGEAEKGRARLQRSWRPTPARGGRLAASPESYRAEPLQGQLDDQQRADLALRAAVFDGRPEAKDYLKRLNASKS